MNLRCSQCDNRAMYQVVDNHPLCLRCYSQFIETNTNQIRVLAALGNQAIDNMEAIAGLPLGGRLHIPPSSPTINTGQTTYNNIQVDKSVVGSINTGSIRELDIMIGAMREEDNQELASVFQDLTHAILKAKEADLEQSDKDSALEFLLFLSEEAFTPETDRRSRIGKAAISKLEQILSNVGSIASVWSAAKPYLDALFGG